MITLIYKSFALFAAINTATAEYQQLAYISSSYEEMSDVTLYNMAKTHQLRNTELNLTGLLLYRDGCMFGIVEGMHEDVKKYYNQIEDDSVHHQIIPILNRSIQNRDFSFWNFAFKNNHFTRRLYKKLYQDEKPFCSEQQIEEHELLFKHSEQFITDKHMSQQVANLIKTFQRTILHEEQKIHVWSRPTLSRSSTSTSSHE